MKKLLAALVCLALCLSAPALAEEPERKTFVCGDYEYALLPDGTAEITHYKGKKDTLVIPDQLDGISVTAIGDMAFYGCSSLTSVTLPDSVTTIGTNPFEGCSSLRAVRISPDHPVLAEIDGVLFRKADRCLICYPQGLNREEYSVPQGIEIVGNGAFYGCSSLTSVALPDSVTTIGDGAFSSCFRLTSVTLPDSITTIGDGAFYGCSSLTSVTLPDSVTTIGDGAFSSCFSLTSVTLPDSVTAIGDNAFAFCYRLTSVTLPDSVTTIADNAFFECPNLKVTVPRDSYALQYCKDHNLNYTYSDALDWLNG